MIQNSSSKVAEGEIAFQLIVMSHSLEHFRCTGFYEPKPSDQSERAVSLDHAPSGRVLFTIDWSKASASQEYNVGFRNTRLREMKPLPQALVASRMRD